MAETISPKRTQVCLLGATGSIGGNTLDVLSRHTEQFEIFALAAGQRVDDMASLCQRWLPRYAVMADAAGAQQLKQRLAEMGQAVAAIEVLYGVQAMADMAAHPDVDMVMAAVVGAVGLLPCLAAARAGKRLLLANKEAIVVGGKLFMDAVAQGNATLLPIDSEHSAIFQCLPPDRRDWPAHVDHIVLTASGGPFRQTDVATFAQLTPEQACAHPNWVMGRKISVDSATMMNKALEVIEARWLFGLDPDQVKVVIHPQSIIHSMVVCKDQSVLAQMGSPDMRVPIAYGLSWPSRMTSGAVSPNVLQWSQLTFDAPCPQRYPGLSLAWQTLKAQEGSTCVLNAANEVAVDAFLNRRIGFDQIYNVNAQTLERAHWPSDQVTSVDGLLALDAQARAWAQDAVAVCERARQTRIAH